MARRFLLSEDRKSTDGEVAFSICHTFREELSLARDFAFFQELHQKRSGHAQRVGGLLDCEFHTGDFDGGGHRPARGGQDFFFGYGSDILSRWENCFFAMGLVAVIDQTA